MNLTISKLKKNLFLVFCFVGLQTAYALDKNNIPVVLQDGTAQCGVPVCDIDKALDTLKGYWPNLSGEYAGHFRGVYSKVTDPVALKNLYDFSKEMVGLYESLQTSGNQDWVVSSANNFYGMVLINLVKNSEVKATSLIGYFNQLTYQNQRHSVLEYWIKKAEVSEDLDYLEELFKVGEAAREQCRKQEDKAWVVNTASRLLNEITARIVLIDPSFEGLYDVSIEGMEEGRPIFDKVVVLDSATDDNLMVSFVNTRNDSMGVIYSYDKVELEGNVLRGIKANDTYTGSSRFEMTYDRNTKTLSGQILTTAMSTPIIFSGIQVRSLGEVFETQNVSQGNIVGFYRGSFGSLVGTFAIKSFVAGSYAATFTADNRAIILHFRGKYLPKNGVVVLTNGQGLKLALSFRQDNSAQLKLEGFGYSLKRATAFEISFASVE